MLKFLSIAFGGAAGALLRYGVSGLISRSFSGGFPLGTLAVNLIGSFLIGLIWGVLEIATISQNLRLFLLIGLLGSFTTFSTFSLENFSMIRDGEYWLVLCNVALSVVLGVMFVFIGFFVSRFTLDILR
ncbi:MAG: fluoride efflux transporter CrcB [Candidatus Orphnella occulta]|nr:fluoride efflux transporter CrcB [Candidatus Orphnella occulta]